jgi:hypothetical protein
MKRCAGITQLGTACKAAPLTDSDYCVNHDPNHAHARKLRAKKGGRSGGRGRPVSELARLQRQFEELAQKVLDGEVERGVGAVAGQLLNGARACVRDGLTAREQTEVAEKIEEIEQALAKYSKGSSYGA